MIHLADLPLLNATLNGISFVLLMTGYVCIRRRRITAHRNCMVAAFCFSILFLASYLTYRLLGEEKKFGGQGWIRPVYFFILGTHVPLAASIPVLASRTLYLALRGRFEKHRRIARLTFPIWVYVSITGVLVYLLLFRLYRPAVPSGAIRLADGVFPLYNLSALPDERVRCRECAVGMWQGRVPELAKGDGL